LSDALRFIQRRLERFYALESAPDVTDFVRTGDPTTRETLVLRQNEEYLEIALVLPPHAELSQSLPHAPCDVWLQVAEGVSHFVYVAERARTNLPATQLELELQAEVDKFVLVALAAERKTTEHAARRWRDLLYGSMRYLHPEGSEAGERYRLANNLAARFVTRLFERDADLARRLLRRFYRAGQAEKIHLACAA
jgi:hypothetical protein